LFYGLAGKERSLRKTPSFWGGGGKREDLRTRTMGEGKKGGNWTACRGERKRKGPAVHEGEKPLLKEGGDRKKGAALAEKKKARAPETERGVGREKEKKGGCPRLAKPRETKSRRTTGMGGGGGEKERKALARIFRRGRERFCEGDGGSKGGNLYRASG